MDARRFGFDPSLPPAFKFDPTDDDVVAHYLLPRAVGLPNPYAHAVIDDDPCSCPPWELMRRHGHAGSDHAFFFTPPRDPSEKTRACRVVPDGWYGPGGTWRGQKGDTARLVLQRGGGASGTAEIHLTCKRYNLTYYSDAQTGSTGWVMHEFQIIDPPLCPVLARVRVTDAGKKQTKKAAAAAGGSGGKGKKVAPYYQDQPGPSNYLGDGYAAGNAVASSDGEGTSGGGAQSEVVHQGDDDNGGVVMGGIGCCYYSGLLNAGEDDGGYYDDNYDFLNDDVNHYLSQAGDGCEYFSYEGCSNFDHRDGGNGG